MCPPPRPPPTPTPATLLLFPLLICLLPRLLPFPFLPRLCPPHAPSHHAWSSCVPSTPPVSWFHIPQCLFLWSPVTSVPVPLPHPALTSRSLPILLPFPPPRSSRILLHNPHFLHSRLFIDIHSPSLPVYPMVPPHALLSSHAFSSFYISLSFFFVLPIFPSPYTLSLPFITSSFTSLLVNPFASTPPPPHLSTSFHPCVAPSPSAPPPSAPCIPCSHVSST